MDKPLTIHLRYDIKTRDESEPKSTLVLFDNKNKNGSPTVIPLPYETEEEIIPILNIIQTMFDIVMEYRETHQYKYYRYEC